MPGSQIDLTTLLQGQVTVKPEEHPEDRAARLRAEERSARIEDWKGVAVFVVLLIAICPIAGLSAYEGFFYEAASMDAKRWSQTVLSAIVTGGIGFVAGRRIGK